MGLRLREALMKKGKGYHPVGVRTAAVRRFLLGERSMDELAQEFGVKRDTVRHWIRAFRVTATAKYLVESGSGPVAAEDKTQETAQAALPPRPAAEQPARAQDPPRQFPQKSPKPDGEKTGRGKAWYE